MTKIKQVAIKYGSLTAIIWGIVFVPVPLTTGNVIAAAVLIVRTVVL